MNLFAKVESIFKMVSAIHGIHFPQDPLPGMPPPDGPATENPPSYFTEEAETFETLKTFEDPEGTVEIGWDETKGAVGAMQFDKEGKKVAFILINPGALATTAVNGSYDFTQLFNLLISHLGAFHMSASTIQEAVKFISDLASTLMGRK